MILRDESTVPVPKDEHRSVGEVGDHRVEMICVGVEVVPRPRRQPARTARAHRLEIDHRQATLEQWHAQIVSGEPRATRMYETERASTANVTYQGKVAKSDRVRRFRSRAHYSSSVTTNDISSPPATPSRACRTAVDFY